MSGSRQNTDTEEDDAFDDNEIDGSDDESRLENRWEANPKVQ